LNYEAKYFFLFLNDEVENKNFLLLNLFDYCYFVFNTKNNQLSPAFFQVFKSGLLSNQSDCFIGIQKNENKQICNIFNENYKHFLNKEYNFIYPIGVIEGKNNLVLATQKYGDYLKTVLFDINDEYDYYEVITEKNNKIPDILFEDIKNLEGIELEDIAEKYKDFLFKRYEGYALNKA